MEEDSALSSSSQQSMGERKFCCHFRPSPYPVYIANVYVFMVMSINMVAFEAALYNKICYSKVQDLELCMNSTFTESHPAIQQESLTWGIYCSLVQLPLSALMNLALSSYCDRVGHKLPYLLPCVGSVVATIFLALLATPQFIEWPMGTVFVYGILYSACGSYTMILMSSFSYVALITPQKNIAVNMAICESTVFIGSLIGSIINGPIADSTSLATLTYINAGLALIPVFIIAIFFRDVTSTPVNSFRWKDAIGINHLLDGFRCVFKKREGYNRLLFNLSFLTYCLVFITSAGLMSCSVLYFVKERGMSMTEYSVYTGYVTALKALCGPAALILIKKFLNIDRNTIIVFACSSLTIGYIITSISVIPAGVWIGGAFFITQTVLYGEIRSLQTSLCGKDELGKMFAYDAFLQLFLAAAASVAFKSLYSATLTFWPEMFWSVCGFITLLAAVTIVSIDRIQSIQQSNLPL